MGKISAKFCMLFYIAVCLVLAAAFVGCATKPLRPLRPAMMSTYNDSIFNYRYFYVTQTGGYTSGAGIYGNKNIVVGVEVKSTNPSSIISGELFKQGFIQVSEIKPENANETMIVSFGETGRRNKNGGYSTEIMIQFVSASTQKLICTCTAEGQGLTDADDVRQAILRALGFVFQSRNR